MTPGRNRIHHHKSELAHRRPPELLSEWSVATGLTVCIVGEC